MIPIDELLHVHGVFVYVDEYEDMACNVLLPSLSPSSSHTRFEMDHDHRRDVCIINIIILSSYLQQGVSHANSKPKSKVITPSSATASLIATRAASTDTAVHERQAASSGQVVAVVPD